MAISVGWKAGGPVRSILSARRVGGLTGVATRFQVALLAKRTLPGVFRLVGVLIIRPPGDGLSQPAIETLEFPGIDRQLIGLKVIVFAGEVAFTPLGPVRASISRGLQGTHGAGFRGPVWAGRGIGLTAGHIKITGLSAEDNPVGQAVNRAWRIPPSGQPGRSGLQLHVAHTVDKQGPRDAGRQFLHFQIKAGFLSLSGQLKAHEHDGRILRLRLNGGHRVTGNQNP